MRLPIRSKFPATTLGVIVRRTTITKFAFSRRKWPIVTEIWSAWKERHLLITPENIRRYVRLRVI